MLLHLKDHQQLTRQSLIGEAEDRYGLRLLLARPTPIPIT
jgi:hypothetical protein